MNAFWWCYSYALPPIGFCCLSAKIPLWLRTVVRFTPQILLVELLTMQFLRVEHLTATGPPRSRGHEPGWPKLALGQASMETVAWTPI